jgi:hypothetical protein
MLNDGSIDDAFPNYYEHYLGASNLNINRMFNNPYSIWGVVPEEHFEDLYNPSPCGGQYRAWPCNERGPRWWPQYLFNHYPGDTPISWAPQGGTNFVRVPEGANTWPDHRQRTLWSQFDNVVGLDEHYDSASMYCLKVPDGYGVPGGPQPGDTGPYWIEVSAGDFPWKDCNWPWSRHTYDAWDFEGECSAVSGSEGELGFYPRNPLQQRRMLSDAGYSPGGDRRDLLRAIDDRCPGFLAHYDEHKPTPHDGPGSDAVNWYPGAYINPGQGPWYQGAGPGGEAVYARPTPPGVGLGNYGPYPQINAGLLGDVNFKTTPPRRIRFSTWARWREWVPWTNFAPVIMNHIERWIMPGRVKNLKKVTIHLPKGTHAFGRGDADDIDYSLTRGDLYFPKSVIDYAFPLRGLNHACKEDFVGGTGATAEPEFYSDHVPGHLTPQNSDGPNFPYGFDLSGTRKSLNAILRRINEDIEIEWVLYPEKDIGRFYYNSSAFGVNAGTAQNNAGIFLGEIIYQTCAYGYYLNDFGDKVWYDTQKECLDFLDPTRICTDYYDYNFPNGFGLYYTDPSGDVNGVPNTGTEHWNMNPGGRYPYEAWLETEDSGSRAGWRGVSFYQKLMKVGDTRHRQNYVHDDLLGWLREFDIWNDPEQTTLDTPVMRLYHLFMNSGDPSLDAISGYQVATEPCRFSGYRPSTQTLYELLDKLHPDLFTAAYDLDPYLRPLKTFNTQKHLVGYYDIIDKTTGISGDEEIKERYITATGPPPLDIRYPDELPGGASAGSDGNMCWGPQCRPPEGAYTGMVTSDVEVVGSGWFLGHKDWGWGNAGGGETSSAGPSDSGIKYDELTLADVVDWYLNAAFYNENGARDDAIAHLDSLGFHPDQIVWANNCPTIGGQAGGNFGGWSCEGGWTEWDLGCGHEGEPTTCEDPTSTNCCGYGMWNYDPEDPQSVCGIGPEGEELLCVDLIHEGPDVSGRYDIINRFPNFWDTLSYSCNSFGTGIMQWAYMKSRGVVSFDDPWWEQFMLPVLEILWNTFQLYDEDSEWLFVNGGCFDFEPGDFWESYVEGFGGSATGWKTQPTYFEVANKCWSNRSIFNMIKGGLICRPEDWNLIPQTNSTLWSPNRSEVARTLYGIDVDEPISDIMYKEQLQLKSENGRQVLPRSLEAVTLRDMGGEHKYGFGYLGLDCETTECIDLSGELSGLYSPAYDIDIGDTDSLWESVINFEAERDLDRCGPIDSPHPCILRFVRPNTDVTLTDRYGYMVDDYSPLQTSKNGVGRSIEMGSHFSGDGILPSHGHGNTFDIRFAYKVPPVGYEYNDFDDLSTRTQIIHHTGKQVKGSSNNMTENTQRSDEIID